MKRNKIDIIRSVVLGHAVGDALGVPVEFCSREKLCANPVSDMRGYGTHGQPRGAFSDDTSMSIAALDAIKGGELDYLGVMRNFAAWYNEGKYTATGEVFDIGGTCCRTIRSFVSSGSQSPFGHGESDEFSCGNGALMRIHPFSLFAYFKTEDTAERLRIVHEATSLTHAHPRCTVASGIYSLMLWAILNGRGREGVLEGAARVKEFYFSPTSEFYSFSGELKYYERLLDVLSDEKGSHRVEESEIRSTGYVVDSLEAAVWCIMTTNDYKSALLRAVNLGSDTDTVAAIAGGLAGALYGMGSIPSEWIKALLGRESIEAMCLGLAKNICTRRGE